MKVAELEGAQLDYWVAKAAPELIAPDLGAPTRIEVRSMFAGMRPACFVEWGEFQEDHRDQFSPSTSWDQGGPIIERERITVGPYSSSHKWAAYVPGEHDDDIMQGDVANKFDGPTPLIAAMRAFVASKFGEEVSE